MLGITLHPSAQYAPARAAFFPAQSGGNWGDAAGRRFRECDFKKKRITEKFPL